MIKGFDLVVDIQICMMIVIFRLIHTVRLS